MSYKKHPQPTDRIIVVIKRLYAFERLRVKDLAQEFNVSDKTIRRDLQKITTHIPLLSKRGVYYIDTSQLSKTQRLPSALLHAFASNAGLSIDCLGGAFSSIPLISFAIAYDGISKQVAEEIIKSIESGNKCCFYYTNNRSERTERIVSPIRLYTEKGKWYLIAKDDFRGDIRPFDFLKINAFAVLTDQKADLSQEEIVDSANRASIWSSSGTESFEVQLYVSAYAKRYLDEVPLHRSQSLLEFHSDGNAVYTYTITHPMELLPEVKNWIPYIHILSPELMKQTLRHDLDEFMIRMDEIDI